jgi:PAS domain S-box-containing protein
VTPDVLDGLDGQFRVLIENAVHITAIVNADGSVRYVSPAVQRMLGYSLADLRDMHSFEELIHPDDASAARERFAWSVQHPGAGQFFEFRARHRDGSWRVLEAIASNHLDDPTIAGIVIDARDVTERKWTAERLQLSLEALVAIHDIGRQLGSGLEQRAIAAALLEGARRVAAFDAGLVLLRGDDGELRGVHGSGQHPSRTALRRSRAVQTARRRVFATGRPASFRLAGSPGLSAYQHALALPLRVQDRVIGILELYGHPVVAISGDEALSILTDQAGGALERTRLYRDLAEREWRLGDLVARLLLAQEEERRRVAYDIHDGLAQVAAAAQQHLEAFATRYRGASRHQLDELQQALNLSTRTVVEARRVIAGLRPSVLDDFGLAAALAREVQGLRTDGWEVSYAEDLGAERLPPAIETALFRIGQEALSNVRKHADAQRVAVALQRRSASIRLVVRDWGRGFRPASILASHGPGARVGLAGIQERVSLLGGQCVIRSRPGAGTHIRVEIPLDATIHPLAEASAFPSL